MGVAKRMSVSSEFSLIGIGIIGIVTYDDMVEQTQLYCMACLIEPFGQLVVLTTGLRIATGMIVSKYYIGGSCHEGMAKKQTYIYGGFGDTTTTEKMMPHILVLDIEQKQMALLMTEVAHLDAEELLHVIRTTKTMSLRFLFEHKSLAQFEGGLYSDSLGRTYTIVLL
jgi:hypothetical protein